MTYTFRGVAYGVVSKQSAPYYYTYFVHESTNNSDPTGVAGYHSHYISGNTQLIAVDSYITYSAESQIPWLKQEFEYAQANSVYNRLVFYHIPLYPGVRSPSSTPIAELRSVWAPLWDQYQVKVAFEHHDHVYNRCKPMKNGVADYENGTLYIGDGAFGVLNEIPSDSRYYVDVRNSTRHFLSVSVEGRNVTITAIDYKGNQFDSVSRVQ